MLAAGILSISRSTRHCIRNNLFCANLEEQQSSLGTRKPRPQHWMNFAVGRTKFRLTVELSSQEHRIRTSLWIAAENAKGFFDALKEDKAAIEADLGEPLDWERLDDGIHSRISLRLNDVDPTDESQWSIQYAWIKEKLERLHSTFSTRLKNLKPVSANDVMADDELED